MYASVAVAVPPPLFSSGKTTTSSLYIACIANKYSTEKVLLLTLS
jgi:hypothetical protein